MPPTDPPSSPTKGELIRSFTTSSQTSADERIAAARAARELRRREREREEKGDQAVVVGEADEDGVRASEVPLVQVESLAGGSEDRSSPPALSSNNPSLAPKLRLHTPSDRSYTPSVPSTPARSLPPSSSASSPSASSAAPLDYDDQPASSTSPAHPSSRRSSFDVAEIPPYRPKTASPAPIPSSAPPSASTTPTPPPPARTPSPGVVMSGGLMARLKAQRAAKAAAEAEAKAAEEARQTPSSATETTVEPASTPTISEAVAPAAAIGQAPNEAAPLSMGTHAGSQPPSTSSPPLPSSIEVQPPSSLASVQAPSPTPSAEPPTVPSTASVETISRSRVEPDNDDASVVSAATQSSRFSPPRGRKTQASKVYGRNGEEFDFDFTELSDVQEQSERSSLSTWRESLHQHRRAGSTSTAANLPAPSSPTRCALPSEPNLNRLSYTGSLGRQQADGSFASSSFDRRYPALPSSFSTRSVSSLPSGHGRSRSDVEPEKRFDATSRLLGRSGSSGSIFSGASSASSRSVEPHVRSPPPAPSSPRPSSPTRRVSPEVARRAAQFESSSDGRRSPTKPQPLFSPASDRPSFLSDNVTVPSSHPKPPPIPSKTAVEPEEEEEDPLVAIERRRTQRRQEIESFRLRFGDAHGATADGKASAPRERTWSEIEAVERMQEEKGSVSSHRGRSHDERQATPSRRQEWRADVVEVETSRARSRSSHASSTPSSPRPGPICEGYLKAPPSDQVDQADFLARPEQWTSRYSVLTSDTLEFRPTDQNHQSHPIVAFYLADCLRIDDEPDKPHRSTTRPFAAVLRDGRRLHFACESRVDRVRWVLALQDAVQSAHLDLGDGVSLHERSQPLSAVFAQPTPASVGAESVRSLTPPGSRYSETRGTVYDWDDSETTGGKARLPSYPLGLPDLVDEKKRLPSPPGGGPILNAYSHRDEKGTHRHRERDLFSLYGRASPHPTSSVSSVSLEGSRALPNLPAKGADILPPLPSPTRSDFAHPRHRRARSDFSSFNTPHDQPPFRPTPTHATPSHELPPSAVFSPSSMLPARPSTRSSTSTNSTVPPEEVSDLHRDLQRVLDEAEAAGSKKLHRDQRYRRLQDRLRAFKQRHGGLAEEASTNGGQLALADKVDYLLEMNDMLLKKQEEAAAFYADAERARRLAAEEKELSSKLATRIDELVVQSQPLQHDDSPQTATPSIRTVKAGRAYDNATFTTRAGIHSASEKLEWERDLQAYRVRHASPAH
ncbi:hypothetical protein JCM6882_006323 [Rhodosporidiobolus microsporus]